MSSPLPVVDACWNRIGVWGDRTCPELQQVTHCHNCPVFAAAGRRFLDAPSPPGYLDEWTTRLAAPESTDAADVASVLVFRLGDEWLALSVARLVEVTARRPAHRVPHRGGLLAGMVNIRGELHLCVRLDKLLGLDAAQDGDGRSARLVVARDGAESWVFAADEVDQVRRFARASLSPTPPTLSRALSRLTTGIFGHGARAVGLLDDARLFSSFRERLA
ncbi:MAG TPA: chemotaxis protein CheW [Gemmata sp.]|nr:chemotaxis protein CheW [Gemmata sp.]